MTQSNASPEDQFIALSTDGRRLLADERRAVLSGAFDQIETFGTRKQTLLGDLETLMPQTRGTRAVRSALTTLIAEGKRNERILSAARRGLAAARRRIEAIEATRRGDVAYAADGTRIISRSDATGKTRRA
ncbi:MAG: hypothetical protein AAFU49_03590 [Pseudomonadota bacterium]